MLSFFLKPDTSYALFFLVSARQLAGLKVEG